MCYCHYHRRLRRRRHNNCVFVCLYTGGTQSRFHGNDGGYSSSENRLHHLHRVRLLLDPVHSCRITGHVGHTSSARSPVYVHASAPARQH